MAYFTKKMSTWKYKLGPHSQNFSMKFPKFLPQKFSQVPPTCPVCSAQHISLSSLSSFSLIIRKKMLRLLLDVSSKLCHAPWPSLRRIVCFLCPCVPLCSLSISLLVFLGSSSQLYSNASPLLTSVHFPLKQARTTSIFAVLFCQPMSSPSV